MVIQFEEVRRGEVEGTTSWACQEGHTDSEQAEWPEEDEQANNKAVGDTSYTSTAGQVFRERLWPTVLSYRGSEFHHVTYQHPLVNLVKDISWSSFPFRADKEVCEVIEGWECDNGASDDTYDDACDDNATDAGLLHGMERCHAWHGNHT